jgi:hypothetical protein
MHCAKNICENVMKTIFGMKNTIVVWEDLKECNTQPHLWLQASVVNHGFIKPAKSYVLTYEEKERFIQIIETLKTPTHYVSSLNKRIKDQDLKGMKSHGYHIVMQEILFLCMQHLMTKEWKMAILHLCQVFKRLWIQH